MFPNTTFNNTKEVHHIHSIPLAIHIIIAALITILNSIVIFIYISMKKQRNKIPNYLMFAQALVDMYQAAVAWYETAVDVLDRCNRRIYSMNAMSVGYAGILEYSLAVCLLTLMLAAVERYICITKPFFHRSFVTRNRVMCGSISVYIISTLPALCLLACAEFQRQNLNSSIVVTYSYVFDFMMFLIIVLIIGILAISFKAGKDSLNAGISEQKKHLKDSSVQKSLTLVCAIKKKVRLVIIFSIMMAAFLVSVLPFAVGRLLYDAGMLKNWSLSNQYILLSTCHIIYKSSSLFNPLLTLTLKDDYREKLVMFLWKDTAL